MNSLNILSARVIGQSIPGSTRPRSRSQGEVLSSKHAEDYSRGRSFSAQGVDDARSLFVPGETTESNSEELGQDSRDDVEPFSEKTPLLTDTSKSEISLCTSKLKILVKKIADALTALLTTLRAPLVYVVSCFKDDSGHYSPFLPMQRVRPLFGGRPSTALTTKTVVLSKPQKEKSRGAAGAPMRGAYSVKLRTSASNESLTSNTSESEGEKKTRSRNSELRRPKSKLDENVAARRSIRIQEHRIESVDTRKQKRRTVIGEEPLTLDTIKSPMSASQSLKIHKYPHAPAPPRPLIPRRQPSYSNLIPRAPSARAPRYQKTLILDLDETLIHSLAKGGRMSSGHMVEVKLNAPLGLAASFPNAAPIGPQHPILYYVHKRPHCDEFLRKVCQWYRLVVFTASVQEYADPVIDWLEQERKFFQGRFYRQHCTFRNGAYIKDLSSIEPDLSRVAILDNSPMSYIFHEDNAIPIEGWINDPTDNDLLHLIPLLEALQYVTDVRALLALRRGEAEV